MRTRLLFFILISLFISKVHSEDLKFLSTDFPPYTYPTEYGGAGAMHDVVMEIVHRLGYKNSVEFVPWARARFEAENKPNTIIIPLARTKDREDKYTWLLHVLDDPYVVVALKDSKMNISTLEEVKKLKIGILSGSVADALLHEKNFTNIESASTDVQNVKKLKLGRIDAWVAPLSCIGQYKTQAGIGKEDMRVGVELTRLNEYIGASKTIDKETVEKWNKTFLAMKKDGTYQSIMKKYGMTPLK